MTKNVIQEKSYQFALMAVNLSKTLKADQEHVLASQLLRSATSVGANVEEALAGQSLADFISKRVSLEKKPGKLDTGYVF